MIIGLSGRTGAGKGEVLAYLQSRSFYAHSLSDVIRDELRRQGQDETREPMIEDGNPTREKRARGGLSTTRADERGRRCATPRGGGCAGGGAWGAACSSGGWRPTRTCAWSACARAGA